MRHEQKWDVDVPVVGDCDFNFIVASFDLLADGQGEILAFACTGVFRRLSQTFYYFAVNFYHSLFWIV